ncbi:urokinase plasminogen activator surface receptor-like isoform X2 [Carassius carassius]|uniref:urokinase plasminogen activator surface receptor-like isoform X2 n=1 Tax=Carassius carassius TaxID=217509 RepID=UPI0028694D40|nr:urokinase plasminogen activator surface receptor-like isoform X2 [Carassius carassius]
MDLQISVFLLFVLFPAGHSLSCYECSRGNSLMDVSCSDQEVYTCPTKFSKCMSATVVQQVEGITTISRGKGCSADCRSGSQNVGFLRNVIKCCDTDRCNTHYAPVQSIMVPNGKKCYYCDEKSCSNILCCSGSEDGCFTITPKNLKEKELSKNSRNQPMVVKGCISKEICRSVVSNVEVISCCSGNLCNGVQSVSQSNGSVCCSLLSFILLH